ncbi:hypothetical protein IRT45_36280 [Nocardia sp. BSTN01]|uniref:hypothetical protein n=1 Tax=Nocardia sp. BSTN01 TaxID=2783665 RepID=UPI00188FDBDA|nr:hypothetical protein [Nocardia sp. BSTN01]MBF5002567.1 hypothetical protein [Nocardia sp. BSTN01]
MTSTATRNLSCRAPRRAAGQRNSRPFVHVGEQFPVRGAGPRRVSFAFGELAGQLDDLLFETGDSALQRVDVGRCAESGFLPDGLAQELGTLAFELFVVCGQAADADLGVGQIDLERGRS